MSDILAPRIVIAIDGASGPLAALVTSLVVTLRFPSPNDSAEIEVSDNEGATPLPQQNASLRIAVEQSDGRAIDIFSGRVTDAAATGDDRGRRIFIHGAGPNTAGPAQEAPLVCRAGQNLVSWSLPARLAGASGAATGQESTLLLTAEPELRPGHTVTVAGARAEIDSDYYVSRVTHRFSDTTGFSTELRVTRPTA
jgi:phage protein D